MGLLDKVKAGAEQAKELAEQAAARAKEEARELQLKRELGQREAELGRTVVSLVEAGEMSHPSLEEQLADIRALREELADLNRPEQKEGDADEPAGGTEGGPAAGETSSEQPPPAA